MKKYAYYVLYPLLLAISAGFAYFSITKYNQKSGYSLFFTGGQFVYETLLMNMLFSIVTLTVVTILILQSPKIGFGKAMFNNIIAVFLSYSPLILLCLFVGIINILYPKTIKMGLYILLINMVIKGISPIVLFYTFFKTHKIEFSKSSIIVSVNFFIVVLLSKIISLLG